MKRVIIPVVTSELCHYGCNQLAQFKNGSGNLMCSKSSSSCPTVKKKNSEGLKKVYKTLSASERYQNLPNETKEKMKWNKGICNADFSYGGKGPHKLVLIQERGHRCEECKNTHWLGSSIVLELDHIDGNRFNNTRENLRLLCPNCHSLTPTWRGRNIPRKHCDYVSDEDFLEALQSESSVRQALIKLGMSPKGGNYNRAYRLIGAARETRTLTPKDVEA